MSLSPTSLAALQVKAHSFPVVSIRANPNGKATAKTEADQQVSCLPVPEMANQWSLELQFFLHSTDANDPFFYEIEIHIIGVVEIIGDIAPEKRQTIAAVNGLSILYSACREMILNVTARSVYGAMSIPSLNFAKVLEEARENLIQAPPPAAKHESGK